MGSSADEGPWSGGEWLAADNQKPRPPNAMPLDAGDGRRPADADCWVESTWSTPDASNSHRRPSRLRTVWRNPVVWLPVPILAWLVFGAHPWTVVLLFGAAIWALALGMLAAMRASRWVRRALVAVAIAFALFVAWFVLAPIMRWGAYGEADRALQAIKKLEARLEIGITRADYTRVLGQQYAEVKPFLESEGARILVPRARAALSEAMEHYRRAKLYWDSEIQYPTTTRADNDAKIQQAWQDASAAIRAAERELGG